MGTISRREFIGTAAMAGVALAGSMKTALAAAPGWIAIPDHRLAYSSVRPTRPVFSGYMGSQAYRALNKPSLPSMYSRWPNPQAIVGAIVVESSGWIDDNLWYWRCAGPIRSWWGSRGASIRGRRTLADMSPTLPATRCIAPFARAGSTTLTSKADDGKVTLKPDQVANLKLLAQADLALDTANPSMNLMQANVLLADAIPNLRIIMDHLPSFDPTPDGQAAYEA
jgi:L-fuconolactonase